MGASVAAGLDLLQAGLADCPAMGAEGVLASVRVKNGRLVGMQGLAEQLRQQHNVSVPYKVTCADQGTSGLSQQVSLDGSVPGQSERLPCAGSMLEQLLAEEAVSLPHVCGGSVKQPPPSNRRCCAAHCA